jgi:hypothetical protein
VPIANTRVALLGAPRGDKEFDRFARERDEAQRELAKLTRDLLRLERRLREGRGRRGRA